ncbi:MAG: hypothetical protein PHQ66_03515 [Candidatus Nanoarchaeia archaeon]|nr:hypothetical protein [Candidatus Nanoarchaeia archaeon]MDD5588488.1 hypothetical protein [Candidatus Nanoarchaeia archaeon]
MTLKNQIPTTKTVLPTYQNILWVISKKEFPETSKIERRKILNIFSNRSDEKEKSKISILFFKFIFGVDRFKISKRKYAEPATQAPIISIGMLFTKIIFEIIDVLKKDLRRRKTG